jgi:hypothetical protein
MYIWPVAITGELLQVATDKTNSSPTSLVEHLFNYANQMHNVHSLHTFTVSLLHIPVLCFTIIRVNFGAIYLKPYVVIGY